MQNSFTQNLLLNEEVLAVSRRHWSYYLVKKNLILLGISLLLFFVYPPLAILLLLLGIIPIMVENMNTEIVLTNLRLRARFGKIRVASFEDKATHFVGRFRTDSDVILSSLGSDTIIIEYIGKTYVFKNMTNAKEMSNALFSIGSGNEIHILNKL